MNRAWYRLTGAAVLACVAMFAFSLGPTLRIALAIAVGVPSFALMMLGRRQLGRSFAMMPAARALVTSGLYARIQHPMYLFLDLGLLAAIVAVGWRAALIAWAALLVVQVFQSRREESVLADAFGAEYEAYRRHTWL